MEDVWSYQTITNSSEGLYKEKGSKFIGIAFPCSDENTFMEGLKKAKAEHHSARHHCYAYAFGPSGEDYRANDDGEPSGTAGRPIHGQLRSFELTDTGIVVVRYYGGTKLGASGLIRAYREAAKAALEVAKIISVELKEHVSLAFPPEEVGSAMRLVDQFSAKVLAERFTHQSELDLEVPKRNLEEIKQALNKMPAIQLICR